MQKVVYRLCVFFALLAILTLSAFVAQAKSIRSATVDDGSVVVVKTSIGYSTILEFSSKPMSAVLGDQDSFKLEYVGNSITIKPLFPKAKSNLFVFTEYERFNCELHTVPANEVDYIVRIRAKEKSYPVTIASSAQETTPHNQEASQTIISILNRSRSYAGFTLSLKSITHDRSLVDPRAATVIDFELSSMKSAYEFQSRSLAIRQGQKFVTTESLYLDSLALTPMGRHVHGKIALLSQDFDPRKAFSIVFAVPDAKRHVKVHLIEVGASVFESPRPKKMLIKNKNQKGVEPWEQEKTKAPKENPVSFPSSLPSPIPSVAVDLSKLGMPLSLPPLY